MLNISKEVCTGCGICEGGCPFGAILLRDGVPEIQGNCTGCGICAKACPAEALTVEENRQDFCGQHTYKGFFVVGMGKGGDKPDKVTLELLSEARKLADRKGEKVTLLTVCDEVGREYEKSASCVGCDRILAARGKGMPYEADYFVSAISQIIESEKPEVVLFPATVNGRDAAPKTACRLGTGLTADCTALDIDPDGNPIQIRPTYGGSIMASIITPLHRPQMASIRPNVMEVVLREPRAVTVEYREIKKEDISGRSKFVKSIPKESAFLNLEDANLILAGGYGLKSRENIEKMLELSRMLNAGAAVTRKVVDEGWAPAELQVGQTGVTVAPDIYIAFGISGALQHTLGIKNAKKIIAVNKDPAAPIFNMCDVGILGDASAILEECCQRVKQGKTIY